MKRKLTASLMIVVLAASSLLTGCDWGKADRRISVAGYTLHLSTEAAAKAAQSFNRYGRLNQAAYASLLRRLEGATEATQRINLEFDKLSLIEPGNRTALFKAVDDYLALVDGILNDQLLVQMENATLGRIRTQLAAARIIAAGIQSALLTLQKPVNPDAVKVDKEVVKSAERQLARVQVGDALLTSDLLSIAANFTAQLSLAQGQTAAQVKALRDAKYRELADFLRSEINRNQ